MNREILFRGKSYTDDKWHYGFYVHRHGTPLTTERHEIDDGALGWNCYPDTIGQYTGLTGKNGVKIFEGDIVLDDDITFDFTTRNDTSDIRIETRQYTVKHNQALCGLSRFNESTGTFAGHIGMLDPDRTEVIGNIHDNPELLKEAPNE